MTNKLVEFAQYQKQRAQKGEIAESTIPNYFKAIKLFCVMNDIIVNWQKLNKGIPRGKSAAEDRAPTIEEIQKLLEYPDRRIKSIVLIMVSSGIRVGAFETLRWKHIIPIKDDKENIVAAKMTIYPGDKEEYFTFITPEAYGAIKDWMDFRRSYGENDYRRVLGYERYLANNKCQIWCKMGACNYAKKTSKQCNQTSY